MPTYTTVEKVASLLQVPDFGPDAKPTKTEVETLIERAESKIDKELRKSWKTNSVTGELQDFNINGIKLYHFPIKESPAPAVYVWDGGSWSQKTKGRDHDYIINYDYGLLYWTRFFLLPARISYLPPGYRWGAGEFKFAVKIDYSWGFDFSIHPQAGVIEDVATKIAAIDIITNMDMTSLTVSGTDKISLDRKIEIWNEQISDAIEELRGIVVI